LIGGRLAVLNPEHLIELAIQIRTIRPGRKPRQVDLRRAISTAYYAVFHQILTAAADEFVGKSSRNNSRYALVYRSIDHKAVRRTCEEAYKLKPGQKFAKFLPPDGFSQDIRNFASDFMRLQELRHDADYDPSQFVSSVDAMFSVFLASSAIQAFNSAKPDSRKLFLTLVLFPPR
jgi:hypothetical protein